MQRITLQISWPWSAEETRGLLAYAFQVALLTYLGLYILEDLQPGLVEDVISVNGFLWLTVMLGAGTAIWPRVTRIEKVNKGWFVWVGLLGLAIVAGVIMFFRLRDIGTLSIVLSVLTSLIVMGIGTMTLIDEHEPGTQE